MQMVFDFVYCDLVVHGYPPSVILPSSCPSGYGPTTQKKEEKY